MRIESFRTALISLICVTLIFTTACQNSGNLPIASESTGTTLDTADRSHPSVRPSTDGPSSEGTSNAPTVPIDLSDVPSSVSFSKADLDSSESVDGMAVVTFSGSQASIAEGASGVSFENGVLTITEGGVYRLSGRLTDGQVVIKAPENDKVRLILKDFEATSKTDALILAESGDKLILTLASGSVNRIMDSDSTVRSDTDLRSPAAIYSKISLTMNGSGKLEVSSSYNHTIATKKTLRIVSGELDLSAQNVGLKGNNTVAIAGGKITIDSAKDAIKTEELEDASQGNVVISGGQITVETESDGINGSISTVITGGEISITTTGTELSEDNDWSSAEPDFPAAPGGAPGGNPHGNGGWGGGRPGGGWGGWGESSDPAPASKGIKAGSLLCILGGRITVNSTGHAVHSSGALQIGANASITINSSKGKGIQAHGDLSIEGGTVDIQNSTEGIESKTNIKISGGNITVYATDDGMSQASSTGTVEISGGSLNISVGNGDTDGIDSNNTLSISGGQVVVRAGSSSGNMAAFDIERTMTLTGGTVVILGDSSAPRYSGNASLASVGVSAALSQGCYRVLDMDGKELFDFEVFGSVSRFWIGSELLQRGEYTLVDSSGASVATLATR